MNLSELATLVEKACPDDHPDGVPFQLSLPDLFVARSFGKTRCEPATYKPMVALILQGTKSGYTGDKEVAFEAGQSVVISHETPLSARIAVAEPSKPFLALLFLINLPTLRRIKAEIKSSPAAPCTVGPFIRGVQEPALLQAMASYITASQNSVERAILSTGIRDEIHLRLLESPLGHVLAHLADRNSKASGIQRAIEYILGNYDKKMTIETLSTEAGMSSSSLFTSFKKFTGQSPNQYVRSYRMNLACRMLSFEQLKVSEAAYKVGYKSLPQFSRDFKSHFGVTPSAIIAGGTISHPRLVGESD